MQEFDELKAVNGEIIAQGNNVAELRTVGEELLDMLDAMDCGKTPKAREIRESMDHAAQRYDQMQAALTDRQHRLNDILVS